jgi:hypothetical protein
MQRIRICRKGVRFKRVLRSFFARLDSVGFVLAMFKYVISHNLVWLILLCRFQMICIRE